MNYSLVNREALPPFKMIRFSVPRGFTSVPPPLSQPKKGKLQFPPFSSLVFTQIQNMNSFTCKVKKKYGLVHGDTSSPLSSTQKGKIMRCLLFYAPNRYT